MIVGYRELEPADQRVQPTGFLATGPTGWHVCVADDATHLEQRRVVRQTVSLEHDLEGAQVAFVAVLRSAHVEGMAVESRWVRRRVDEEELRLPIDELSNEPWTRRAVNVNVAARDPSHVAAFSWAAAASKNVPSACSQRSSTAAKSFGAPSPK